MNSIDPNEMAILETEDARYQFASFAHLQAALSQPGPSLTMRLAQMAEIIYDKKGGSFLKERSIGAEKVNALLGFARAIARGDFREL